jgi:acetyl esterase
MSLDEATAAYLASAALEQRPMRELTVAEARAGEAKWAEQLEPGPQMADVRNTHVAVAGGRIPVRILVPNERPRAVIVFYHGGGWVLGSIDESDVLTRHLASRTNCAVVSVGYRLAPEYRYPTAVDDASAALEWSAAHMTEIAGARVPVIVAGDSAGGNIAAVVARRAHDRGGPGIALQVLVYPVTDCDFDTLSYVDPANQVFLLRDDMVWFWDHYAPEPEARKHPDASPMKVVFLSGLPPAVVLTAEHDVLRDEGELYAMRLVQAGVPVEQRRFEGQVHGFLSMTGILPGSEAGLAYIASAIERCLERESGPR